MKISLNWLNDFVDIKDEDPKIMGDKITNAGVVVETIDKMCTATKLIIGQVMKCEKHPDSDHLNVCEVNLGDKTNTIICGAANVKEGIKVIVAPEGAVLPEITIKKTTIRGIESNGMICALSELGLEDEEAYIGGIHILNEEAPVGANALAYLGLDDTIYNLDLEANRNDCLSIKGFAYATAAALNKKVVIPEYKIDEIEEEAKDHLKVSTETKNCTLFLSRIVKNVVIKESPNFIKSRLIAAGMRPINNVVDISNYIMLEYGQPLHFYDKVSVGNEIVVKMAKDKEVLTTLDNKERTLTKEDIVITDGNNSIGLAGVMGGLNSEITDTTTEILVESAIFTPYNIRYTSINNQLRSEASLRFEKGLDPKGTLEALNKAAYLLQKYADGKVLKGIVGFDNNEIKDKEIEITLEKINSVLGMKLTTEDVNTVWEKLEFDYSLTNNTYKVIVPTRRLDISIKEDLIEEIGSIYGYSEIPSLLPINITKDGSYGKKGQFRKNISKYLRKLGMQEVRTYTLVSEKQSEMFKTEVNEKIVLPMPMSEDKKVIRRTLIPSLINTIEYNLARKEENQLIYEISNIYYNGEEEETKIAIAGLGIFLANAWQSINLKVDFYLVKGMIENLLNYLGLENRYEFKAINTIPELHPNRGAEIIIDRTIVGFIGEVHPLINKNHIITAELSLDKLLNIKTRGIKYKEVSNQPKSTRDLALIAKESVSAGEILTTVKRSAGKILKSAEIFDIYKDSSLVENTKSIAIKLIYQSSEKTLSDEEVNASIKKILETLEKRLEVTLRN